MTRAESPYCGYPYVSEVTVSPAFSKTAGEIMIWFTANGENITVALTR